MVVKNTLKDYNNWRAIFDDNKQMQIEYGLHVKGVYQTKEDPNQVFVVLEVEDLGRAQEMVKKIEASGLMDDAGVIVADRTVCVDVT